MSEVRLIDADALQKKISALCEKNKELIDRWFTNIVDDEIENAPTIDPVKHGRWITKSTNGEFFDCCSSCGYVEWDEPKNYCSNCGAMMEGYDDEQI